MFSCIDFIISRYSSLKSFMAWDDVKNMLEEKVMTEDSLKNAWKEAAKGALIIAEIDILNVQARTLLCSPIFQFYITIINF